MGKMNKGLVLPAVWEDTPEEGTLQLDLQGCIYTAFPTSVPLILGELGLDHRMRRELIKPWHQLGVRLLLPLVTASQAFLEGLRGQATSCLLSQPLPPCWYCHIDEPETGTARTP